MSLKRLFERFFERVFDSLPTSDKMSKIATLFPRESRGKVFLNLPVFSILHVKTQLIVEGQV